MSSQAAELDLVVSAQDRLNDLISQYGADLIRDQTQRQSIAALHEHYEALTNALTSEESLTHATAEVLGWLAGLSTLTTASSVRRLAQSSIASEISHQAAVEVWKLARRTRNTIETEALRRASELERTAPTGQPAPLQSSDGVAVSLILSNRLINDLEDALHRRRHELQQARTASLEGYESQLSSLQASYLVGENIREILVSLTRVDAFRELLDLLADSLDSATDSTQPTTDLIPTAAVLRYTPLIKFWRDVRLALDGRINHWISIRPDSYVDTDRGYPQVELRVFSHAREIFHTKDDVDDVLALAVGIATACTESVESARQTRCTIPPEFTQLLLSHASRLEAVATRIKDSLKSTDKPRDDEAQASQREGEEP